MTELRKRMIECLQLRGLSERTQEAYVRAVRQLSEHYHKSPDQITEEELRQYFLFIKNVEQYARGTSTVAICGIKFFFERSLAESQGCGVWRDSASTAEGIQLDETAGVLWGLNETVLWREVIGKKNAKSQRSGKARKDSLWSGAEMGMACGEEGCRSLNAIRAVCWAAAQSSIFPRLVD